HEAARGLGLAIAKRVCDMQGWSLTVESSQEGPARGTRFLLRFRQAEMAAPTTRI
ncbi:MAG: sensor histidine kinase, partial [Achromobacter mucicolens]